LKHVITVNEGFSKLNIILESLPLSLFECFLRKEGVRELDVPFVVRLLNGSYVFLDVGLSFLFFVFPPFLIYV